MKAKQRKSTAAEASIRCEQMNRASTAIRSDSPSKRARLPQFNEFKLTIELVPQTSWYANLRKSISKAEWDKLRKRVYAEHSHRCGICGTGNSRLNCHEIWDYDESNHRQTLIGFFALCDLCHHVKHIGLASILAARGELDYEKVIEHFMEVNGCDRTAFEAYRDWAFEQWAERSKHNWQVELGEYANLIHRKEKN